MKSSKYFIILPKQGRKFVSTHTMPFIETYRHEIHHSSNLIAYSVNIFKNQIPNKYGTSRENMSRDTNKRVMMHFKKSRPIC